MESALDGRSSTIFVSAATTFEFRVCLDEFEFPDLRDFRKLGINSGTIYLDRLGLLMIGPCLIVVMVEMISVEFYIATMDGL